MTDPKETILESCLEEVLANQSPPDLTARIMQEFDTRRAESDRNGNAQPIPFARPVATDSTAAPTAEVTSQQPNIQVASKSRRAQQRRSTWRNVMIAAGILGIGVTVGIATLKFVGQGETNSVADGEDGPDKTATTDDSIAPDQPVDDEPLIKRDNIVNQDQRPTLDDGNSFPDAPKFVDSELPKPEFKRPVRELPSPSEYSEVVATINTSLQAKWDEANVSPAEKVSDAEWCVRAFDRIVGRPATGDEIDRFVSDDYPDKRLKLVDELVSGEAYANEYADHWASVLTNALIGPAGGNRKGDLANRDGLTAYLRDAITADKPYDQMAFELIAATGSSRPGTDDFNGATNFMLAVMDDKAALATGHTARVFMGSQIQCARCHDFAGGEQLTQKRFWEFNSFLRQMEFQRDPRSDNVRLVNVDFVGEGDDAEDAIVYYENADGELKAVGPAFDGETFPANGLVAEVDRRTELAKRVIETDEFARTAVNRVWSHFLTYGLSSELQDIGSGSASHEELLDRLSTEFAAHKYNMKDIIRWVALSDAFELSSQDIGLDANDLPEIGDQPLFTRYYNRPQAEPVPTALASAAKAHSAGGLAARVDWAYMQVLGKKQEASGNADLFVPVMPTVVSERDRQFIQQVAASDKLTTDQKVQHLFMAAVTRAPRANELNEIKKLSAAYENNVGGMLEVIWIVLTKSNEFVLDN